MKLSLSFILCFVVLSGCQSFNKTKNSRIQNSRVEKATHAAKTNVKNISDKQWLSRTNIYQELTGEKINSQQAGLKLIKMAESAQNEKNYILALKRYNTVISRFPKSKLTQTALVGKANLYKIMGLNQQAQYNMRLAREFKVASQVTSKVTRQVATAQTSAVRDPSSVKKTISARSSASSQKTGIKK